MNLEQRPMLVFSAHAADFCSRAGGMIALTVRAGTPVHVIDLTFGERGESEDCWLQSPGAAEEVVKEVRRSEAAEAAKVLGATIDFLDYGDYPLLLDRHRIEQLARIVREHRPRAVVTHWNRDPHNPDHQVTARAVGRAITIAAAPGFEPSSAPAQAPALWAFEPTVPRNDDTGFRPNHYVVIDSVFEQKMEALNRLRSQSKLPRMYTQWAEYRGAQARQWSGRNVRFAEAYFRHSALVGESLL